MTTITAIVLLSVLQYTLVAPAPINQVNRKLDDLITEVESMDEKLDTIANVLAKGFGTDELCYSVSFSHHFNVTILSELKCSLAVLGKDPPSYRGGTNSLLFAPDGFGFFYFKSDGSGSTVGLGSSADECYKGMSSLNKPLRTLVTIPGNRTVLCDTVTDEGGWIVIQRRADGKEDFFRDWDEYKSGFGDVTGGGDYWLGNEIIHQLTWTRTFGLRVDMVHQGQKYFAHYSSFYLGDETTKYTLHIGKYTGDAGDDLSYHNKMKFTTYDLDSDNWSKGNCAVHYHAAWWYNSCHYSNLNGVWGATGDTGINWRNSGKNGLSFTEMKIRLI